MKRGLTHCWKPTKGSGRKLHGPSASRASQQGGRHELALNPDHVGPDDREILSTLVHEMVHLWQREHGKPPRRAYHDRQWAAKMIEVGLQPSDTGAPGGKTTGQHMTHYVIEGGRFALAFHKLAGEGFQLRWQSQAEDEEARKKEGQQQDEIHLCGMWRERVGQARYIADLRRLL